MIARYGDANSYIEIEDDSSITAVGQGDYAPGNIAFFPRTDPGPSEGTGGYEVWRKQKQTVGKKDKPIQLVDKHSGMGYLFIFRANCSIDFYYLGHNFHTGTVTYLFIFQVGKEPGNDSEKKRIYDWIKNLKGQ